MGNWEPRNFVLLHDAGEHLQIIVLGAVQRSRSGEQFINHSQPFTMFCVVTNWAQRKSLDQLEICVWSFASSGFHNVCFHFPLLYSACVRNSRTLTICCAYPIIVSRR